MKSLSRIYLQRITFAILIPIAAWGIQAAFWPIISPYVWFLFYPAVFFSAWIGGLPGGTAASILSALIVWWYFIPPAYSFAVASPGGYFSIVIFLVMGILFGYTQERLKHARARASSALSAARLANDQLLQANTQITQLYEKNRELDHLKSQFFANVSHELPTPTGMESSTFLPQTLPVVLVVEDDPDMNAFIAAALSLRFRVVSAFDGNEGLHKALEEHPDLVIADVMMPVLSGDQMVSAMRQHAGLNDVPVMMLTARVDEELRVKLLRDMVQDFVYKPVSVEELLARVSRLMTERAQKKQAFHQSEERFIQELQESEARLTRAQAAAHVGNWEYNLSDQRLWASAEAFRIYGMDRTSPFMQLEEARRLPTAEDRPRLDKALSELLEKRLPYNLEFRMRRANDGAERVIHTQAFLECDAQDKPLKVVGVLQDITESKQAEEALRQSEERWQFALEGPGDGVWDWDFTNNKIYFSQNWKAMLGYAPDDIGDTLDEWDTRLHPDDREATYAALNQYLEGRTPAYTSEHRLKCKDGSYKWILARGKVVSFSLEGKALRMIGTHTDITERKQSEAQLREQLVELRRWHAVMLGRETRVTELKAEVNQLLEAAGQPLRYASLQGLSDG